MPPLAQGGSTGPSTLPAVVLERSGPVLPNIHHCCMHEIFVRVWNHMASLPRSPCRYYVELAKLPWKLGVYICGACYCRKKRWVTLQYVAPERGVADFVHATTE